MRKFLASYEQLRDLEKKLISEGYQEKYLNNGNRLYGKLIKIFATRSQAAEFRRRTSLFGKDGRGIRPQSPVILPKKIDKSHKETQTEAACVSESVTQTDVSTLSFIERGTQTDRRSPRPPQSEIQEQKSQ